MICSCVVRNPRAKASRVDETIREHAREARSFLHERASEQLLTIPEVDEETTGNSCKIDSGGLNGFNNCSCVADAIYDTFSPRSALQALCEGAR